MAHNPARDIKQNTIKRLYGLSGNVCANPDCREPLVTENNQTGEIAHICAASPNGPRYDPNMSDDERRSIDNLILLCEKCNKRIDSNAKDYPVSRLREWKSNHEGFVSSDIYNTYFQNIFAKQKEGLLRKQDLDIDGDIYSSKIVVYEKERVVKQDNGQYCLTNYLLSLAKDCEWNDFPDIFIQGIGGIGKSTEVKHAYNTFLDVFSDKKNYDDYNFFPIVYFFELKDYQNDFFKRFDDKENIILFLDGLDEIAHTNVLDFVKLMKSIRKQFSNIRFVISGRPASFISEIEEVSKNKLTIDLSDDFDLDDPKNRSLIVRYQNSAISDVISIPFYRKILEKNNDIVGYKDFYEKAILEFLEKDKGKSDYANNISKRNASESPIKKEKIIEDLSVFCYKIWQSGRIVFSEQELHDATSDNFNFVINSSLIKFNNSNSISFVSNLFFEYFLSLFYLNNPKKIQKDLFLASGRLNVKYVNVVSIILNIADSKATNISWLKKKLSKETNASILLTDFRTLPPKTRYEYYKKIFEEYSKKGKLIYYLRGQNSHNCLSGISNLSRAIRQLVPSEYKGDALDYLFRHIDKYHKNRIGKNVVIFINSIMLLGAWSEKIWDTTQQEKLKDISVEIIKTFLYDSLIKERVKGLLYEEVVLYWYKNYGWAEKWSKLDWNEFLKQIFPETQGFGTFANDEEYYFQLEVFNDFPQDNYIKQLAKPLCIEVMKKSFGETSIADNIPNEIDDEYQTKFEHTDHEMLTFVSFLKRYEFLSALDVVDIFISLINAKVDFHSTNYEFGKLKKRIIGIWTDQAKSLPVDKYKDIYEIIAYAMDDSKEFPLYEINACLNVLPDQIKQKLLDKIIANYGNLKWAQNWEFCGLISILLDMNANLAEKYLTKIQNFVQAETFNRLVAQICRTLDKLKPLYQIVYPVYKKEFLDEIEKQAEKERILSEIQRKHAEKQDKEGTLLANPSEIIKEIDAIEQFVNEHTVKGATTYDFFDLDYDTIENNVRCDVNIKAKHAEIFSDFVVEFLQHIKQKNSLSETFEYAREKIRESFSESKKYWIGFYNCFVRFYSDDEVKKILDKNKNLKNKILESMAEDVLDLQKTLDVQQVISLGRPIWITPFVKYVHILLNDEIPEYVEKNRLMALIAYRSTYLATSAFYKNDGLWGNYSSVYDWLHYVAGFEYAKIVTNAISIYPEITDRFVKAQVLLELIKHLDCQENQIAEIIIEETRKVLASGGVPRELNHDALPDFWHKADKKYLDEIMEWIPFEKYEQRHNNPCLREVIEYALKYLTAEQKIKLIAKYKDYHDDEMRELLRRLGSKKEILRKISEYLHGGKVDSNFGYDHAYLFGFVKKDCSILCAYFKLLKYSMEKTTERRSALSTVAKKGLKEHLRPFSFKFLKFYIDRQIKKRIKNGLYVDGLYDFIDEMEQVAYSR